MAGSVTGVDALSRPLRWAREKAAAADVQVEWVRAMPHDSTRSVSSPDSRCCSIAAATTACSEAERSAYARGVGALAAPGATLLLMAFARNTVRVGPAGVNADEIAAEFGAQWESVDERARQRSRTRRSAQERSAPLVSAATALTIAAAERSGSSSCG